MAKVLVAEFNHVIPGIIKKCLAPLGHEVLSATHGEAAIEAWKQSQPDLLMCGVMLPGIDGYELVRRWKSDGSKPRPAVIICGAGQLVDDFMLGQAGVDAVLNYPFKSNELVEVVEEALAKKYDTTGSTSSRSLTPRPARASEAGAGLPESGPSAAAVPRELAPPPPAPPAPPPRPSAAPAKGGGAGLLAGLKDDLMKDGLLDSGRSGVRPAAAAGPPQARAVSPPQPAAPRPSAPVAGPPAAARPVPRPPAAPSPPVPAAPRIPAPPPTAGDPLDPVRDLVNAKFREVTDILLRSLPDLVDRIVEQKLRGK
ncbi:MAG: response regulator transcription factor [Nitrospirae bacterium]|nr:response regulator transcription factor [Nitrospirota bacterium]